MTNLRLINNGETSYITTYAGDWIPASFLADEDWVDLQRKYDEYGNRRTVDIVVSRQGLIEIKQPRGNKQDMADIDIPCFLTHAGAFPFEKIS